MTITLAQLAGHARLAVGGSPSTAPGVTENDRIAEIVNGAGEHLFSRPWRWRERTAGGFDLTADQAFINLATDGSGAAMVIDEIISVKPADVLKFSFEMVTPAVFEEYKRTTVTTNLFYVATLTRAKQTTSGLQDARLDIYPTPTTTTDDAVFIRYREGWPGYTSTQVGGTGSEVIPIPAIAEQLLIEYVRAFAEGGEDGTTQQRVVAVDGGTLLDQALRKDGLSTNDQGALPMSRSFFFGYGDSTHPGVNQPGVNGGLNLVWRGTYSTSNSYNKDDLVHLSGSVYIALQPSTNQSPTVSDSVYWDLFLRGTAAS